MVPGKEICSQNQPGTVRAVTCSFDLQYAENIMGSLEQFSAAQLNNALDIRSSLISAILLRLMHEAINPGAFTEEIVESYGRAMLLECAHYLLSENSLGNVEGQLTAQHFALIEKYLAGLSGELPSVSKLAGICGFSERYFAKLFREQTHCSVAQYIKNFQITKAKSLLLETDLALKEIGYRLGFSTSANFSSAFRAATGITPGQYRKTAHN
jgi:AraC family transcriptional regulator